MEKTWKPTTAGILSLIAGILGAISGITVATVGGGAIPGLLPMMPAYAAWMSGVIAAIAIPLIIIGIVAIVGGTYALRRRIWGLALAGSICALIGPWSILGILAIIFVVMGKDEFK